jgi:hypothetical protein
MKKAWYAASLSFVAIVKCQVVQAGLALSLSFPVQTGTSFLSAQSRIFV